jgi:hypothetical protein
MWSSLFTLATCVLSTTALLSPATDKPTIYRRTLPPPGSPIGRVPTLGKGLPGCHRGPTAGSATFTYSGPPNGILAFCYFAITLRCSDSRDPVVSAEPADAGRPRYPAKAFPTALDLAPSGHGLTGLRASAWQSFKNRVWCYFPEARREDSVLTACSGRETTQ